MVDYRKSVSVQEILKHDPNKLLTAKWYNDDKLNKILREHFVKCNGTQMGSLLDIGCGPGIIGVAFSDLFKEYYGIDISSIMLKKAKEQMGHMPIKSCFYCGDVSKFIDNKILSQNVTHILMKNVCQFIDLPYVLQALYTKYNKDVTVHFVQTMLNKDNSSLFTKLPYLPFTHRDRARYNSRSFKGILNKEKFRILKTDRHEQNFEFTAWLNYHNVRIELQKMALEDVAKIPDKLLNKYYLKKEKDRFIITRTLEIITCCKI